MIVILLKPTEMKKLPEISKPMSELIIEPIIHADEIFKDLEIVQRTQKPPSKN
jgi:hypothetical protein